MKKQELRRIELAKRLQLSNEELQEKTEQMVLQFSSCILPTVQYLLSYYPLKERKEFDVSICERTIVERYPGVTVAWPKMTGLVASMEAHMIGKNNSFSKNRFNIPEPVDGTVIQPELFDVVFVPLLAFDTKGYRVGYGKGFYDRYLPACRPNVLKIGFSYFEAAGSIDDINEFDVPLNLCITPTCIYEF